MPRPNTTWTLADYDRAADEYQAALPPEHYMEGRRQATQREISLESLALLRAILLNLHVFNELLVQYFHRGRVRQVVPDNMVVLSEQPIQADKSFNLELEPAGPFWVLEYVSQSNRRKDYEDSFRKYERELKIPYYLIFDPELQDLRLYRRGSRSYALVKPNAVGRLAVSELELEVALLDGWVRFWHRGRLLELPAELQQRAQALEEELALTRSQRDEERRRADVEQRRADEQRRRADQAEAELARLRALLDQLQPPGSGTGNG